MRLANLSSGVLHGERLTSLRLDLPGRGRRAICGGYKGRWWGRVYLWVRILQSPPFLVIGHNPRAIPSFSFII